MTLADFTSFLEQRLRLEHEPFELRDLLEYAADVWPAVRAEGAPDLGLRALECLKRCRVLRKLREGSGQLHVHFFERDGGPRVCRSCRSPRGHRPCPAIGARN